jgi:hypothetical protein
LREIRTLSGFKFGEKVRSDKFQYRREISRVQGHILFDFESKMLHLLDSKSNYDSLLAILRTKEVLGSEAYSSITNFSSTRKEHLFIKTADNQLEDIAFADEDGYEIILLKLRDKTDPKKFNFAKIYKESESLKIKHFNSSANESNAFLKKYSDLFEAEDKKTDVDLTKVKINQLSQAWPEEGQI